MDPHFIMFNIASTFVLIYTKTDQEPQHTGGLRVSRAGAMYGDLMKYYICFKQLANIYPWGDSDGSLVTRN
jgi:hypothetical protein